ncbi:hypothetical protein [Deinococcus sp. QL22]|uniref:hypothetical protein n=1 Tax=Deinococcus sp. QL22 TaxID=2939437 RepID=UPI0020183B44|nr:hypothetical protein [Deinococcus sp. QL22]UQN08773.1 hypothetical protein M1R55_21910 [Deinococcus sp. QL22]
MLEPEPFSNPEKPTIHIIHSTAGWTAFTHARGLHPLESHRLILVLTGQAVTLVFDIDQLEHLHDLTVAGTTIIVTARDFTHPRSTLPDLPPWIRIVADLQTALEALGLSVQDCNPWL